MTPIPARRFDRSLARVFAACLAAVATLLPFPASGQAATPRAVDSEVVIRAAEIAYGRDLDRARKKRALDADRAKLNAARRAATLLFAYAPSFEPRTAGWSWAISMETRDEPIAYCLPGGKVMLSTGLFDRTRLASDEIGVVIAHAMAHAIAGHDADLALRRLATLPESADPNRRALQLADILGAIMQDATHDKDVERETDAMALELMARAGVNPRPAAETWRKVARGGGAAPPGFLSLHAVWPGRVEEIEAQIPPLLPLFEQAQAELAGRPRAPPIRPRSGLN